MAQADRPEGDGPNGAVLIEQARAALRGGRVDDALSLFRAARSAGAELATVFHDTGVALKAKGRHAAAIASYRHALAHDPDAGETWAALANALRLEERLDEAAAAARRAIAFEPDDPQILRIAGVTLREAGHVEEALPLLDRACAAAPDAGGVAFERAVTRLTLGMIREGFQDYERRFDMKRLTPPATGRPIWRGEPLADRDILIVAEQGRGDMIQFVRLAPLVRRRTRGRVILEAHAGLRRLFQASLPDVDVVDFGEPYPPHDLCVSIMSLPHLLGVDRQDLPGASPYLRPLPGLRAALPAREEGPKVGLTWAGNRNNARRTCPFEAFLGVVEVPGVNFYSLQRGDDRDDIARCGAEDLVLDVTDGLADFADDAVIVEDLDLVITIDTAMCHLAAALGKPTWTLLPFVADWRFGLDPERCPWHPTMRLFRQERPGDWTKPVADARRALEAFREDWRACRRTAAE